MNRFRNMTLILALLLTGCGSFGWGDALVPYGKMEYVRPDMEAIEKALQDTLDAAQAKESLKGKNEKTLILPSDSPIARIFAGN